MSVAKYFVIGSAVVFTAVGLAGYAKRPVRGLEPMTTAEGTLVQEVAIPAMKNEPAPPEVVSEHAPKERVVSESIGLPEADRIAALFSTDSSRLPIVETVSYTSRVPWIQGRPAWIADYASHYATSRHFIARSLNKKNDYFTQKVSPGDRFNVFKKDKNIQFYLLADLSRCRLWFYYLDQNERVLLKTYSIGVGRLDAKRDSGCLTPVGKYSLGEKIAIYKPGTMGFFHDRQVEMVRIFGTRWIPFDRELEGCSESARGLGLHGMPWNESGEDRSKVGKYESDGCIRLLSEDIEEIFSIIITKPTIIEIVKDFHEAVLPGVEKT